ncbi:hypothetical protein MRB53_029755 [Persea americana]|uniref:Uncharacterized protein n=1 Tax=Persea americana TaxID=3435 RepID=A0ACC2KJF1_PERAE|nr:hypothetical protein MRB53_029755 [Persea americana]
MYSSAAVHYPKDSYPPPPLSQPFDHSSATGIPVSSAEYYSSSAPLPLHIQSQPRVAWSTGLCDCGHDVGNCCLTCWCPCITFGRITEIVDRGSTSCGTGGALYTLISLVTGCPCLYSCFYRTKLRGQYLLHEDPCIDCIVHCCCEACALCQEYRELKNRGFDMKIGWHANVEKQTPGITTLPPSVTGGMSRA